MRFLKRAGQPTAVIMTGQGNVSMQERGSMTLGPWAAWHALVSVLVGQEGIFIGFQVEVMGSKFCPQRVKVEGDILQAITTEVDIVGPNMEYPPR